MDGNIIKNRMIDLDTVIDSETVLKMNILLNSTLNGLTLEEINLSIVSKLKNQAGEHIDLIKKVIDVVADTLSDEDDLEIYTSGATNIFKYPELSDSSRASELYVHLKKRNF